ncbi:hypothetical protein, partial [Luteibacter sp.]|uniref:hypothetical protein n=1 Tax=Luteibacter sp. TaxID=1886636 RepID=UPI0025B8938F
MTHPNEAAVLQFASINAEAEAIGYAVLASDFEEARFRAHLVASLAEDLGLSPIVDAARDVELRLGR